MQTDTKDSLEDIATRLHGLGDVLLFLSESQMDAGCGEVLGFLEWSLRATENDLREIMREQNEICTIKQSSE